MACWGRDVDGQSTPPSGTFKSVSAGGSNTCGVRGDDTVACWGDNGDGQATPPSGTFKRISAGGSSTCAIRSDDTVACWGDNGDGQATPPSGTFRSVSTGGLSASCGVRTDGTVSCWASSAYGAAIPPSAEFKSLSVGVFHACGIRTDDTVACWGNKGYGQATPLSGTFKSVSAGGSHTCGVLTNGNLACWGRNDRGQTTPPPGRYKSVTAGNSYSCAIRTDGVFQCWGIYAALGEPFEPVDPTEPATPAKPTAAAGDATATVTWTAPSDGGSPITGYTVRAVEDTSKTCTTTGALTCTVTGLTNGTAYTFQVRATNAVGDSAWSLPSTEATPVGPPATWYHPVSPVRLIDPRPGWKVGPFSTPWSQAQERDVQVTGQVGIPADAKAVVLNVTVTDVTAPGGTFISVYPKGDTRPNVSSLNASHGQTIANSVTTKIGTDGKITIYNEAGTANVIVDVAGYYTQGSGDGYTALAPTRVIDSRPTWQVGAYSTPWNAGQIRDVTIDTTNSGVPTGVDAVVLNVTATDVTQATYVSVYPKGTTRPNASNLNLAPGNTIANQVVVKLGTANQISVYNEAGKANVIVDIVGYYKAGSGDAFYPVTPERIIDPRPAWQVGPFSSPWGNKTTRVVQVTTKAGVPVSAKAVVANVTATDVTSPIGTFVTVFPGGTVPNASNLNAAPGWTIANAVTAKLSSDGKVSVYNEKLTANVIVDGNGYFG